MTLATTDALRVFDFVRKSETVLYRCSVHLSKDVHQSGSSPEALAFYTKTLGIREAYTVRNPDGTPHLTYLQLSRDPFIELIPAGPNQPTGVTHFGIEVRDINATVAMLRDRGVTAPAPGLTPAKAAFTRIADRDGVQIEVMKFGPDALQRKALDAWK